MPERIGSLQDRPTQLGTKEAINKQTLYVDEKFSLGKVSSVSISNKDESGKNTIHEINIEGELGTVGRALVALINILKEIESKENDIKSQDEAISIEDLPKGALPEYGLNIKRSQWHNQKNVFIMKGTVKEDTTKPPFGIEMETGDIISVSLDNIQPLTEKLRKISGLPP